MAPPESSRVLLVDDDARLLASMEAVLADEFAVRACTSGREALRALDGETFHVVCTDWQMPGMNGVEFWRAVVRRQLQVLPCFVLITAHANQLFDQVPYEERKMLGMLA